MLRALGLFRSKALVRAEGVRLAHDCSLSLLTPLHSLLGPGFTSTTSRLLPMHTQHQLPGTRTFKQPVQHSRRVLQAFGDGLARLDLPFLHPTDQLMHGFLAVAVIERKKAAYGQSLDDDHAVVVRRTSAAGVVGDEAAKCNATAVDHARHHCAHYRAADVLEIHMHTVRRRLLELLFPIVGLVVDGDVKAYSVDQMATLVGATGDADDARTAQLTDLASNRTDRTCGCRYHQGFTRLHRGDFGQAVISGNAAEATGSEQGGQR